ncbi:DUF6538 domain-containing protein [Phenylobacterium sp.]|uniref:DUF6538 domain-containing protein n=1 Tax=Phenylobacterium sp. TaxID=1871053 RepID=UPI0035256540
MSRVNPPYLWRHPRSTVYQARVRVPPGAGLRSSHIVRSLKTRDRAEAIRRLPVVVAEIRLEIETARRSGPTKPQKPALSKEAERELQAALWWRQRIIKSGGDPDRENVPDELWPEWDRELETRYGEPVDDDIAPNGELVPVYDPARERRGNNFRAWVRGALPISSSLDRYLAEEDFGDSYRSRVKLATSRAAKWMRNRPEGDNVRAITTPIAAEYVDALASGDITVETVNSHVSALHAYWKWMIRRGLADQNPWRDQQRSVKRGEKNARKRPFTDEEVVKLLKGETYRTLHDLMRLAILSGMRQDEIASLRVRSVDLLFFTIEDAKTAAGVRKVPVHPLLKPLVERRLAGKAPDDFLIEELKAPPSRESRRGAKAGERFTAYQRDIGVYDRLEGRRQANADFHSFRRWFITKLEQAGVAPQIIAAIVGHEEGRDFLALVRYSGGPSETQLHEAVERVLLPSGALPNSPDGPLMGTGSRVSVKRGAVATHQTTGHRREE